MNAIMMTQLFCEAPLHIKSSSVMQTHPSYLGGVTMFESWHEHPSVLTSWPGQAHVKCDSN